MLSKWLLDLEPQDHRKEHISTNSAISDMGQINLGVANQIASAYSCPFSNVWGTPGWAAGGLGSSRDSGPELDARRGLVGPGVLLKVSEALDEQGSSRRKAAPCYG